MLQVLSILQALTALLGSFGNAGIPNQTLVQIHAALDKATGLLAAFQGFKPPNSIQNELDDLYILVGAIEKVGAFPAADVHFANLESIIARYKAFEINLKGGQFQPLFDFVWEGETYVDGAYKKGGPFDKDQLGG